jgi:hypothetical protein
LNNSIQIGFTASPTSDQWPVTSDQLLVISY